MQYDLFEDKYFNACSRGRIKYKHISINERINARSWSFNFIGESFFHTLKIYPKNTIWCWRGFSVYEIASPFNFKDYLGKHVKNRGQIISFTGIVFVTRSGDWFTDNVLLDYITDNNTLIK